METWHVSVCRREDDRARDWSSHDRPGGRERQCALRGYVSTSQHALLSSHVLTLTDCDVSLSGSFRQARPVCVRGPQQACWGTVAPPTDGPPVFRTSTLFQRPTKETQGLCTRDVDANHLVVYFVFLSISSPTLLSGLRHHLPDVGPITWPLLPPHTGARPHSPPWGEERGMKGWPLIKWGWIPPFPPPPHSVTPSLAQQRQRSWRKAVDRPPSLPPPCRVWFIFTLFISE